jgi:long-subunit acyl-CoA synthetase (AMP-forming)
MTEIGMALSNPYEGERVPASVGMPLENVSVRIVDLDTGVVIDDSSTGELQVKGPTVFQG